MDAITSQFRELYSAANEEGRRVLQEQLRDLQNSLDDDWTMLMRMGSGSVEVALAKIGSDLGLFKTLADSDRPLTVQDLVEKTGAAPRLLGHVLKGQASFGLIKETGKDHFTANRMCRSLADVHAAGAMTHVVDVHGLCLLATPSYLKERNYKDITTNKDLPFHKAFKTDLTPFDWMRSQPEQMESMGHVMAMQRAELWVDHYPVEKEVGSFNAQPGSALLVDVGGGFGQQAVAFRSKFPNLAGRYIVQDVSETLKVAPPAEGVEFVVHDFFTEEVVKDAKFYYLRHILHDWPDEECVKILKAIIPAMGPDSRIVIDEIVLPDEKWSWQQAYFDLAIMVAVGGVERTKQEWEKLIDQAGLRVYDIHNYDHTKNQSVILAVPK